MNGDLRPVAALDAADIDAWRALAGRAVQPNPLFEPECLVPAADHLSNGRRILVASAQEAGRWYGCFAVQVEASWRAVRRPVLVTQVRRMQYSGVPLLDPQRPEEAMTVMLRTLRSPGLPGITVLDWLDDGPVADQLVRSAHQLGMARRPYHRWERPVLREVHDAGLRQRHSRKWARNQERMGRRMGEELGGEPELRDRSGDPAAVDLLLGLEAAGYKRRSGVAAATQPGETAWFRQMCDRFRSEGRLHVYTLGVGVRTVAVILLVRGAGGLFALKTTYDEELARYSPGIQLHLALSDHVRAATDAGWIDTCTYEGNDPLLRLYPDRQGVSSTVLATGGLADRAVVLAVAAARALLAQQRSRRPAPPPSAGDDAEPAPLVRPVAPRGLQSTADR